MRKQDAVTSLAARAQDTRLDVFRLLVEAGPDGMPAGHIASSLRLPPNALTFHLDRLREGGLETVRRDAPRRFLTGGFGASNALIGYLTDQCCQGHPELCKPKRRTGERKKPELVR